MDAQSSASVNAGLSPKAQLSWAYAKSRNKLPVLMDYLETLNSFHSMSASLAGNWISSYNMQNNPHYLCILFW